MRQQLQARGPGLCPINVEGYTDSLVGYLEREGYTDLRVVVTRPKEVQDASTSRRTTVASTTRRVVTRRPRT